MNTRLSVFIRFGVSIGLLALLFWIMRGEYGAVTRELAHTKVLFFLASLVLYAINIGSTTWRLRVLLEGEDIHVPFPRLVELTYIGFFFNNFMPTALGGDIVKAYYTGGLTNKKAASYVSVFMDRLVGLFSFAGIGCVALAVGWSVVSEPLVKHLVLIFVSLCLAAAFSSLNSRAASFITALLNRIRFRKVSQILLKVYEMLHAYRNKKLVLVKTIGISVVSQLLYFSSIYLLFRAVHIDISFKHILLIMPLVSVVSMLPSLGGLGLREGAIVTLFGPIVGNEQAFSVSILLFAILFLISVIGGIIYAVSPQFRKLKFDSKAGQ